MENQDSTISSEENSEQHEELSHSDKMSGIITEPSATFEATAKFPPKTIDWILPVIFLLVVTIISQMILFSNPEIKFQMQEKQREAVQKMVDEGKITQEQADKQTQFMSGGIGTAIRSVSILIFGFVFFLLITAIYFLFSKFALKGDGTYASALVANGLTAYIVVLQIIIVTVVSILMGKMLKDVSVTSLLGMDKSNLLGWLLSFIDVFAIWAFAVLSIGLAKMFKAKSTAKYFIMVFGLWFLWKVIVLALGNTLPFLKNF